MPNAWWPFSKEHPEPNLGPLIQDLDAWSVPSDRIASLYDAARASLTEVKALTEYEDGKIARLLTVAAFISAAVGAVFTRFATVFPSPIHFGSWREGLIAAIYLIFVLYGVLIAYASAVLISAIRPRFNEPMSWKGTEADTQPKSMMFYSRILEVTPRAWGQTFKALTPDADKDAASAPALLKERYAKNLIVEAYLIADKVAHKLKAIDPGVKCLRFALWLLLPFFILFGLSLFITPPPPVAAPPTPHPVTVNLPAPVVVVQPAPPLRGLKAGGHR